MDEDCESLLRQALEVSELPNDYDPKRIPSTGEEYLHSVIYEKRYNCEEYLRADMAVIQGKIKNKTEIQIQKGCEAAPKNILPSLEWQKKQSSEFSSFRLYIENLRNNLPPKYLVSTFIGDESICRKLADDPPRTSDIISYNQNHVTRILQHHVDWIDDVNEGASISQVTGAWIYGLLARLETPLTPAQCFMLRELARKCSRIRSALPDDPDKELFEPLNLFICLVSRYFNQADLADE